MIWKADLRPHKKVVLNSNLRRARRRLNNRSPRLLSKISRCQAKVMTKHSTLFCPCSRQTQQNRLLSQRKNNEIVTKSSKILRIWKAANLHPLKRQIRELKLHRNSKQLKLCNSKIKSPSLSKMRRRRQKKAPKDHQGSILSNTMQKTK